MGEDVDDFVVRTKSKTDQIIRDYTAVADNAYKGVSVLDENGNLRDTYDILLDISKIYKKIQEEDKKFGTNRAQALVETLAGKNRSNIVASILQNGDILEAVREDSLNNFQGSADEELGKYLDSIEGKVAQFKNRLQELASVSIDSTWIKNIVDFGSSAISVISSLVKQFGSLNLIIGGGLGILFQKTGKGLFNFDKQSGPLGILGFVNGLKEVFNKVFYKTDFGNEVLNTAFKDAKPTALVSDIISKSNPHDANQIRVALGSYYSQKTPEERQGLQVGQVADDLGKKVFTASNAFSTLKKIGVSALSSIATVGVTMVASFAIEQVIKGIYDFVHAEEIAIEKGKKAKQEIDDINKGYNEQADFLKQNQERFLELRKGVNTKDNSNKNLSDEEYSEFLELNNQLANLFPQLVKGYDSQGNALLTLSGDAQTASSSLKDLLEQERQIADFKVSENLRDAVAGTITRNKQLQKDINKLDVEIGSAKVVRNTTNKSIDPSDLSKMGIKETEGGFLLNIDTNIKDRDYKKWSGIQSAFNSAISDMKIDKSQFAEDIATNGDNIQFYSSIFGLDENQMQMFREKVISNISATSSEIDDALIENMAERNDKLREQAANWNALLPSLVSQMDLYGEYKDLTKAKNGIGEQLQQIIIDDINSLDLSKLSETELDQFEEAPRAFLADRFLDPIADAMYDADTGKIDNAKADLVKRLVDLKSSDFSTREIDDQAMKLSEMLFPDDVEKRINLRVALGLTYMDGNKEKWDSVKMSEEIASDIESLSEDQLYDLSQKDLYFAYELHLNGEIDFTGDTVEEFEEYLDRIREDINEFEAEDTLSSIFNDEGYKTSAENYEKKLTSLTGALDQIKEQGKLTVEQMRDLQEEFPDLIDFSQESIQNAASTQLGDWITDIEQRAEDMKLSPEGMEQLNTYLQNLTMSYGNLGITAEEAQQAVYDSVSKNAISIPDAELKTAKADSAIEKIQQYAESQGEEVNWQIVWTLAMEDRFSDPAADIVSEYQDMEFEWKVRVDLDEEIAESQKQIETNNANKSTADAARQYIQQTKNGKNLPNNLAKGYLNSVSEDYWDAVKEYGKDSKEAKALQKSMNQAYDEANATIAASFDTTLQADKDNVEETQNIYEAKREQYEQYAKNDTTSTYYQEMKQAETDYYNALTTLDQDTLSSLEFDASDYTNQIDQYERDAADLQLEVAEATAKGLQPSSDVLDKLYDNYINNAGVQDALAEFWDNIANDNQYSEGVRATAQTNKTNALKAAQELREQAEQTLEQNQDIPLENYRRKGEILSMTTQDAEDVIAKQEKLGRRVSESMYDAAIDAAIEERDNYSNINKELLEKKENFENQWKKAGGSTEDMLLSTDYQNILKEIDSNDNAFDAMIEKIRELRKAKEELKFSDLQSEFQGLQREATALNYALEDRTKSADAGDYLKLMANNLEQQRNLQAQIDEQNKKAHPTDERSSGYQEWASELENLESQLHSTTEAQLEFLESMVNLPVDNITKAIQKYEESLEDLQNNQDLKMAQGQSLTHEDYQQNIEQQQQIVNKRKVADRMYSAIDWFWGNVVGAEEDSEIRQAVHEAQRSNQSSIISGMKNIFGWQKENRELDANNLTKEAENLGREATRLKNEFDLLEAQGNKITEDSYKGLVDNNEQQIQKYQELSDEWLRLRDAEDVSDEDWMTYDQNYTNAKNTLTELQKQQIEYNKAIKNIPINDLKNNLEDLQTDATNIQDAMSFRETRGLKATVKDYQKLMKNSAEQIKNIKTQNDLLRQQQAELIANNGVAAMQSSTYRDIQAQIESNNQSLRGLAQNQYDWGKQIATGQIQNIMDSMSAAQQAMSTGHLADTDTLKNLITMNRDYASALVTTTSGTYVDAQAMAKLAEDQGDLTIAMIDAQKAAEMMNYQSNVDQMMSMAQQIDPTITSIQQLNQALAEHPDSPEWSKIFDLSEANFNIQSNLDQLQAMKEQILATQSYLGQYQMAQSSWNFSDPMQQIRGGLEGAKQLYDQGWWGKDDFTSFAKMIATNEQLQQETFVDNFMDNYQRAQKYLTEDISGVNNWIQKMQEEGYTETDKNGNIKFDIKDMQKFANDMGFNTEFSEYMLMAMKDAGYQVDISRLGDKYAESYKQITGTEANAGLQMQDLLSQMEQSAKAGEDIRTSAEQAGAALQRMKEAGMSDDAISKLVEQYNELGDMTGFHIDPQTLEVTTTVDKSELEETEEEINKPKDMMVQIKEEYDISDEDITKTNNAIQRTFEGNKANLDQELSTSGLSDYSAEDLLKIDFEDGQYLPDTAEAESALENLAVKIGLVGSKSEVTNDVAQALVATLLELNSISSKTEGSVSEADQTRAERFDLQKKQSPSEEPLYNRVVSEASQLSDSSAHSFLATEQENLKSQEITYKIKTELEGGTTMNDLAKLTDEEIMTTFHCDASEVDEVRSKIEEMANSDGVDFTVKINEDQLTDLGTTISDAVKNALTGVDSSEATTAIEEIKTSYEELETAMSGEPLEININAESAIEQLEQLKELLEDTGLSNGTSSGEAEGLRKSTAPPTKGSANTQNAPLANNQQQQPTQVNGAEDLPIRPSAAVQAGNFELSATAVIDQVDDSAVQGADFNAEGQVKMTPDASEVEAKESEIEENPIKKIVNFITGKDSSNEEESAQDTEVTNTTHEVVNKEENTKKNIEVNADTGAAVSNMKNAKSAEESIPKQWHVSLNADDNISSKAKQAANEIRQIPTSWTSIITANVTGLDQVEDLRKSVDKLQDKEITIKATTVNIDGTTSSSTSVTKPSSANAKKKTGNTIAPSYNGTAHTTGTALPHSPAHAKGTNWAIENDETALVNELGTEGLVRDGRFYQIPGGAQYINLKRGDIIFNHKQVEELNKHGHVISGGGHGKAYANGTLSSIPAHYPSTTQNSTASGTIKIHGPGSGGGDSGSGTSGLKTSIDNAAKAVDQGTAATTQGSKSTTQAAKNVETNLDKFKKWADSLFDWIEVRMERLQHSIDINTAQSELNTKYQQKNAEINAAMKTTRQMISDQEKGAKRYEKQADAVAKKAVSMRALSQGEVNTLVKLIQNGDIDIKSYKARKKPQQSSSSKARKKSQQSSSSSSSSSSNSQSEEETPELTFIEEYKEWWDKSEQMRLSILENKQALKDLAQTKLDNIIEQYDTIVGLSEQIQSKADAQKENYLTYGKDMRSKSVEKTVDTRVDQQKKITKARQEEEKAYQKELKSAKKDFGENSNQYREALARLEEVRTARIESQTAERQIKVDYQEERLQSIQDKWEQLAGYAAAVQSSSESMANLLETQGTDVRKSSYKKEIKAQRKQQKEQTKAYQKEMKYYEEEMKRAKKLYGESNKMYIDAKTNFEEMKKNHRDSMQQYIEIEKNYQQKRLDYLKEKWDSFINLAEARQATAKSKEGLYNAQGRPLNGTQIKDTYIDQRYQQDQVTKYYRKLQKDLQAEEKRMRNVYGKDSNEYRAWQAELEAATKGLNDSKTASLDLRKAFMELDAQVMNFDITRLKQSVESMANSVALREKRGTRVGETGNGINDSDYTGQISANQKQIALYRQLAEYYRLQQTGFDKNSKQYMEYEEKIYGAKNAIDSLNMSNEELKESARNNRWKSFYKLSDQLDLMVSDYTHLIGLMNEESFFDDNGNGYQLTMNGLSAIALYGEQIEANRQKVALYQEGLKALNEELKNNMIGEEKYIEEQKKLLGGVQEATTAIHSEKEAIIALTKTQLTNEANMLKKIIQNRKDALSAKKA